MSTLDARARDEASAALAAVTVDDASPFASAETRVLRALGLASGGDDAARVAFWRSQHPGSRSGEDRYRWDISHRRRRPAAHALPVAQWGAWRPDLERDPDRVEQRLALPLVVAETCEYLDALAEGDGALADDAHALLHEAEPLFRRDFAAHIQCAHPFADTLALYLFTRRRRTLARLHPVAVATAVSLTAMAAHEGAVRGLQYPFFDAPLVSASAQLASGLLALGVEVDTLAALVEFVRRAQKPSGAWGDPVPAAMVEKFGDADALTTFVATELLARLDPTFDATPSLAWMLDRRGADGFVRVYGPEGAWLTGEALLLARAVAEPFEARFAWPYVSAQNLDRKTGRPFFAYFDDLARMFAAVPGIAGASVPLGFVDLAGFREFNNRYGQDLGDAVLRAFAEELATVPGVAVIRDGGDEFLVVGAPGRAGLATSLDAFRMQWPSRFRARFGDEAPPVAPRILVATTEGRSLRACREDLGRSVGALKIAAKVVGPEGALRAL